MELDECVVQLIAQVKSAIAAAAEENAAHGMRVGDVTLELKTMFEQGAGGEIKILKLINIGANVSRQDVQTIAIELTPVAEARRGMLEVTEPLLEGFDLVRRAIDEAISSPPAFGLKKATVTVQMGVTGDGSLKLFVGPAASWESAQTVTLELLPLGTPDEPPTED